MYCLLLVAGRQRVEDPASFLFFCELINSVLASRLHCQWPGVIWSFSKYLLYYKTARRSFARMHVFSWIIWFYKGETLFHIWCHKWPPSWILKFSDFIRIWIISYQKWQENSIWRLKPTKKLASIVWFSVFSQLLVKSWNLVVSAQIAWLIMVTSSAVTSLN